MKTNYPIHHRLNHQRAGLTLLAAVVALTLAATAHAQQRGRPTIQGTTLVTDTGHLLRGAIWSTDYAPEGQYTAPPEADIAALASHGINAVHLYAEAYRQPGFVYPGTTQAQQPYTAGSRAGEVDKVVAYTRKYGLYCVITIGNGFNPANYNATWAKQFWAFYAPRYANETHVVYEIQNEPYVQWNPLPVQSGYSPATLLTFEKEAYTLIRANAPNTPVLFFSYAVFRTQQGILSDLRWVNANVFGSSPPDSASTNLLWKNANAAVALHGYAGVTPTSQIMSVVLANGFPCVATEFYDSTNGAQQDVPETIAFEDQKVSWLTFLLPQSIFNDAQFRTPLDQAGVVWVADFGTWPASSMPPAAGTQIGLKALGNGKWVTTGANATTDPLVASQTAVVNAADKFVLSSVAGSNYFVALKSVGASSGGVNKFADADSVSSYMIPERNFATSAKLEWMNLPDGTVALKTYSNNKFVSLDASNPPKLIANQPTVTSTGRFAFSLAP
jgi:Cellulase (glycosyl hydrolase family 5)